jgi:hypothetical protein
MSDNVDGGDTEAMPVERRVANAEDTGCSDEERFVLELEFVQVRRGPCSGIIFK